MSTRKWTIALVALAAIPGTSWSKECTLPADVSLRIGRAQTFGYKIPDLQVLNGTRDYIWQGDTGKGTVPSSVFSGYYVTADRAPYQTPANRTKRLAWYQANHPDWIVYRPDQKTPAWEFCDALDPTPGGKCDGPGDVPLAIWKPEVQGWMNGGDVQTAIDRGIYQGISADNVLPSNSFFKGGTCSVIPDAISCTHAGGVWTPRYSSVGTTTTGAAAGATTIPVADSSEFRAMLRNPSGVSIVFRDGGPELYRGTLFAAESNVLTVSPALGRSLPSGATAEGVNLVSNELARDWVNWLSALKTYANSAGKCLTINIQWDDYNRANWALIAAVPDMIFDEQGFGNSSSTKDCSPGGGAPYNLYDTRWINKATDLASIGKPKILQGAMCTDPERSLAKLQYNVASYLLVKDRHSYQELFYENFALFERYPPLLYLHHGSPIGGMAVRNGIYYRTFEKAVALVNPSSTISRAYDLGPNVYHGPDCKRYEGNVLLPPISGLVLKLGEAIDCVP